MKHQKKLLKKQTTTKPVYQETDYFELTKGVLKNPGKDYFLTEVFFCLNSDTFLFRWRSM